MTTIDTVSPSTPSFSFVPTTDVASATPSLGVTWQDTNADGTNLLATMYGATSTSMSTAKLIAIIIQEVGKTRDEIAIAQGQMLKLQSNRVQAQYAENIKKLNDAAAAQAKVESTKKDMEIVKWVLFSVSLLVDILSLGASSGVTAAIGSVITLSITLLQVIPCDAKGTACMDAAQEELKKLFETIEIAVVKDMFKDAAKEEGLDLESMDRKEIMNYLQTKTASGCNVDEANQYSAMALILAIQVVVAVVVAAVGYALRDSSAGTAAVKQTLKAGENAVVSGVKTGVTSAVKASEQAAQIAAKQATVVAAVAARKAGKITTKELITILRQAFTKATEETAGIRRLAAKASKGAAVVNGIAQVGNNAAKMVMAGDKKAAADQQADAQLIAAVIKSLLKVLANDEQILKDIMATQTNSTAAVQAIIRASHQEAMQGNHSITYA